MRVALISGCATATNRALQNASRGSAPWEQLTPREAFAGLRRAEVAIGRLDVLPTLDGVEEGLWVLGALEARGVVVLNEAGALLAAHDKLLTARLLRRHGIPHPETWHVRYGQAPNLSPAPTVLKPRFGSWGREVRRCDDPPALVLALAAVQDAAWFRRHGALVQELVPPQGYDLRVVVAGDRVVGAAFRVAAAGEWRTNVALGGVRRPVSELPRGAAALAVDAARAAGLALVGVDLLPDEDGGWIVAELNGAVEFSAEYAQWHDVFAETVGALAREAQHRRDMTRLLDPVPLS